MRLKRFSLGPGFLIGLSVTAMLVISACAAQPAPAGNQAAIVTDEQIAESTPTGSPTATEPTREPLPTETSELDSSGVTEAPTPAATDEDANEAIDGYPEPGEQYPPPAASSEVEPYPSPKEVVPPPIKTALVATDPATVDLAKGKPQLLEFFAFW